MKLGFIGAGNMATALARGIGEPVVATDRIAGKAEALVEQVGGEAVESAAEVADASDAVVLAHKPAQLTEVARRQPADIAALEQIRGLHRGISRKRGQEILAAVARGLEAPPLAAEERRSWVATDPADGPLGRDGPHADE